MDDVPNTPVLPAGLPEAWVQTRDVFCPSCRYNLRMLHRPRCPECGLIFRWQTLLRVRCPRCNEVLFTIDGDECPRCMLRLDWPRLLEDASQYDRTLFEYSDRPVRAALRTWVAALNPWRFWGRIPLELPPAVERLRRLRRAGVAVCLLGLTLITGQAWKYSDYGDLLAVWALALVPPAVTTMALPLFTPTLTRFRIRQEQLLRCLAYATSGWFWIGACFVAGFLCALTINRVGPIVLARLTGASYTAEIRFDPDYLVQFLCHVRSYWPWLTAAEQWFTLLLGAVLLVISLPWWWAFLYVSLRRYLRLDRRNAIALWLSTQIVGLLLLGIALLNLSGSMQLAVGVWLLRLQELAS